MEELAKVFTMTILPLISNYFPFLFVIVVGWITLTQLYFTKKRRIDKPKNVEAVKPKNDKHKQMENHRIHKQQKPGKKKQNNNMWQQRKQTDHFTHDWILKSLKGHDGTVLDMDFSSNGKFLVTCGDDDGGGASSSSSGSEANKENANPGCRGYPQVLKQKKNKIGNGSPPISVDLNLESAGMKKKQKKRSSVLQQYIKLNLSDTDIYNGLKEYTLKAEDLFLLGFPVESRLYPGRAIIFKNMKRFDSNATEYIPQIYASLLVENGESSFEKKAVPEILQKKSSPVVTSVEKKCVRCFKSFFISSEGEYLTQEHCTYHWGKIQRPPTGIGCLYYDCCKEKKNSKGCSIGKLHVWNGLGEGTNGPYDDYVRTKPKKTPPNGNFKIYALDCEMCFTTTGLELAKISVVTPEGKLVYDTHVKPESCIIDYNTRFSGVTAKDLSKNSKMLKEVQNDLMSFITAETILVGHGLENDLRALKMIHTMVIDTSVVFPHFYGFPYKRSLKSIMHCILKRDIQAGQSGHDPTEDARSCLELVLWKLRKDQANNKIQDLQ